MTPPLSLCHKAIDALEAVKKYDYPTDFYVYLHARGWNKVSDNARVLEGLYREYGYYHLCQRAEVDIKIAPPDEYCYDFIVNGTPVEVTKYGTSLDARKVHLFEEGKIKIVVWRDEQYYRVSKLNKTSGLLQNPTSGDYYYFVNYETKLLFNGDFFR